MAEEAEEGFGIWGWLWRGLLAVGLLISAAGQIHFGAYGLRNGPLLTAGLLGMGYGGSGENGTGWIELSRIEPGGPADAAGFEPGDQVRFDRFLGSQIAGYDGDEFGVTVDHMGEQRHVILIGRKQAVEFSRATGVTSSLSILSLIMLAGSALLLIAGRRKRSANLLAMILFSLGAAVPTAWLPAPVTQVLLILMSVPVAGLFTFAWASFCFEISGGPASRRQQVLVYAIATMLAIANMLTQFANLAYLRLTPFPFQANLATLIFTLLLGFAVLWANYRRNDAIARNRIKIVFAAFLLFALFFVLIGLLTYLLNSTASLLLTWVTTAATAITLASAIGLLIFAVLRQRLFDFNFALNRTLVYGAAAFTLLVAFGLVEYIAKSMIPVAWPTAGPFISAGLAVLLFLSFHRLHHWFEHQIERFFFKEWQEAEKALKRFVHSASHFDEMPALCSSTVEAVSKFAGGADAALYLRGSDGSYRLEAGRLSGAPASYAEDNSAFALMRAERKPLDLLNAPGALPGELALPMIEQGALAGFVLLAGKQDGTHYRPDQVELLDRVVHHVGLDMRSLHARQLEAEVVGLIKERNTLKEILTASSEPRTA